MKKPIDVSEAEANFDELLDKVSEGDYFLIEKEGVIMAAMISLEEYQDLVDIRAEIANPKLREPLKESKRQHEGGEVGTEEDIFKKLRNKDTE